MARIYPDRFPHDETCANDRGLLAERGVYNLLKEQLPKNWVVLYNQWRYHLYSEFGKKREPKHLNYEADFVVLVPEKGYVVIEVKDWINPETRADGYWYRYDVKLAKHVKSLKGSPLKQAFMACKNLHDELCLFPNYNEETEYRCLAILYGASDQYQNVAYCQADEKAANANKVPKDEVYNTLYVVGSESLNNIQERIEALFINKKKNVIFTEDDMELVRSYLFQCVRFKTDPVTCTSIMERASAGIDTMLPRLETSLGGIHVSGCAGSGKTWMACNEVIRLRNKYPSKKILFLCFNRNLADYVRDVQLSKIYARDVKISSSNVQVATFHDIFRFLADKAGIMGADSKNEDHLSRLLCYIEQNQTCRYDYIFVDEGQDIERKWWNYVIKPLKRTGGSLYAFSDSNQHIYTKGRKYLDFFNVRILLDQNLRNACEIAQLSTAALPEGEQNIKALAFYTQCCDCSDGIDSLESRAKEVRRLIKHIRDENPDVKNKDIVVLSPYITKSSFNYLDDVVDVPVNGEDVDAVRRRRKRCSGPNATKVYGETVRAFKGLEAPFVILTDINRPREGEDSGFTPNDFYVACTRAKYGLYIVPSVDGERYVREVEKKAANLPSPLD